MRCGSSQQRWFLRLPCQAWPRWPGGGVTVANFCGFRTCGLTLSDGGCSRKPRLERPWPQAGVLVAASSRAPFSQTGSQEGTPDGCLACKEGPQPGAVAQGRACVILKRSGVCLWPCFRVVAVPRASPHCPMDSGWVFRWAVFASPPCAPSLRACSAGVTLDTGSRLGKKDAGPVGLCWLTRLVCLQESRVAQAGPRGPSTGTACSCVPRPRTQTLA